MATVQSDQAFVETLVKSIVANPNDVSTERTVDEMGVLITLKVNPADMGYVIGRQGQTARAIRTLLKIVGAKNNARVNLKIYEPEGSRRERMEPAGGTRMGSMDQGGSRMGMDQGGSRMSDDVEDLKI